MSAVSAVTTHWHSFTTAVRAAAVGKWTLVLTGLGVAPEALRGRHGPCPGCGGVDRFRFHDRDHKGGFVCSQGGGELITGDGFALIMHVLGGDFRTAVTRVADCLGIDPPRGCGVPRWVGRHHEAHQHDRERVHRDHGQGEQAVDARDRAQWIWAAAQPYSTHPYLVRKGIEACGTRLYRGLIVVPARDSRGALQSLGFIAPDGTKRFLRGGRTRGCYFMLGGPTNVVCIAEGFATAASIWQSTGWATACAFSAYNLQAVAETLTAAQAGVRIVLCADDDKVGRSMALVAARAVGGRIALPPKSGVTP